MLKKLMFASNQFSSSQPEEPSEDETLPIFLLTDNVNAYIALLSNDGIDFSQIMVLPSNNIRDVICVNGLYVLVGNGGKIFTSTDITDPSSWVQRTSGTTATLWTVAYGNGVFVAAGVSGLLRTSVDGITWNAVAGTALGNTSSNLIKIRFVNGYFIATWGSGTSIRYSVNGTLWTNGQYLNGGGGKECVIFDGTRYLVGTDNTLINIAPTITSLELGSPVASNFSVKAILKDGDYYYAGKSGYGYVYRSTNLINWTQLTTVNNSVCNFLVKRKGAIYAGMSNGKLYRSADGLNFSLIPQSFADNGQSLRVMI